MTEINLTNANGIGSEVILQNPDTNNGNGKIVDISKITTYVDTVEDLASLKDAVEYSYSVRNLAIYTPSGIYSVDSTGNLRIGTFKGNELTSGTVVGTQS